LRVSLRCHPERGRFPVDEEPAAALPFHNARLLAGRFVQAREGRFAGPFVSLLHSLQSLKKQGSFSVIEIPIQSHVHSRPARVAVQPGS
jgi:hypothetical protein